MLPRGVATFALNLPMVLLTIAAIERAFASMNPTRV